jgi:RNA polymerase sigma factor (sigma-70 family)
MTETTYFKEHILSVKNKLYRFACYYLRDREAAEDVVQEVFLKVWSKRAQWAEVKNMEAWCMHITKNMCLDKIRARKGYHDEIDHAHHLAYDAPNPEHALLWGNQAEHLRQLVQ